MIKNKKQLKIAKSNIDKFTKALKPLEKDLKGNELSVTERKMLEMQVFTFEMEIKKIKKRISEFHNLESGKTKTIVSNSFHDIPKSIIKLRIAKGWTQAQLADVVGININQIQRYEKNNYANAAFKRLEEIYNALCSDNKFRQSITINPINDAA